MEIFRKYHCYAMQKLFLFLGAHHRSPILKTVLLIITVYVPILSFLIYLTSLSHKTIKYLTILNCRLATPLFLTTLRILTKMLPADSWNTSKSFLCTQAHMCCYVLLSTVIWRSSIRCGLSSPPQKQCTFELQ